VLCLSERTLLPVVLPGRELATLGTRLASAAGQAMAAIGSMNDFAFMLAAQFDPNASLLDLSLDLAETPCGPLRMESPMRATLAVFSDRPLPLMRADLNR